VRTTADPRLPLRAASDRVSPFCCHPVRFVPACTGPRERSGCPVPRRCNRPVALLVSPTGRFDGLQSQVPASGNNPGPATCLCGAVGHRSRPIASPPSHPMWPCSGFGCDAHQSASGVHQRATGRGEIGHLFQAARRADVSEGAGGTQADPGDFCAKCARRLGAAATSRRLLACPRLRHTDDCAIHLALRWGVPLNPRWPETRKPAVRARPLNRTQTHDAKPPRLRSPPPASRRRR
jgi:hypothetical protein